MILPKFDYRRPRELDEALEIYEMYGGEAVFLAGGTDLIPRLKLRLKTPKVVIDLKGIKELSQIKIADGFISIGANTTIFDLKENDVILKNYPPLYLACTLTSCETLQMRGTVGGNILQDTRCLFYNKSLEWRRAKGFCYKMGADICHATGGRNVCYANYASDLAPALLSLDAYLVSVGKNGKRTFPISELFSGDSRVPFNLKDGEILKEILIKNEKKEGMFEKIRIRGSIDYPLINGAISGDFERKRLVIGAVGPRPLVYEISTSNLIEAPEILENVYRDLKPVNNTVVSALYIKKMGRVIAKRLLNSLKTGD
ncbi:MAG: FAD binding domain-containing protein [Desulfobacterota bacterium]|nr:FAD binding domain-containing protein [Thermodesulfobacteriota bacterium]MDW8001770.1 FAD binding domain-containing protein [Deltaproteobacteria bacterium]